jgi:hypothetical protein
MRTTLTALATAATVAAPSSAEARWGWRGPGVVGGLIAGGLIAGALAPHYYDYGYYPAYGGYDGAYCWRRAWNGWRWVHYRAC